MSNIGTTELETTVEQWRDALFHAERGDPGQTAAELAFNHGLPKTTVINRLESLVREGKCKKGRAMRLDSRGSRYTATVYQLEE